MDVYEEFKKYCEENPENLRAEVMSGREMARRAFFYAWVAAQQTLAPDASQESAKMIDSINETVGHLVDIGAIQRR